MDATDDASFQVLHKLGKLVELPDFVKSAAPATREAVAALPITGFADPVNRKFPVHTKAAAFMSQLYFLEARHRYPSQRAAAVQDKLSKAAAYWGISDTVKTAANSWEKAHNGAVGELADSDYAIVVDYEGEKRRLFPIHSEINVKAAGHSLFSKRAFLPYEWRLVGARRILHKAAELQVQFDDEVDSYLQKAAGFGSTTPSIAAEKLAARALMAPKAHRVEQRAMAKLAKAMSGVKVLPPADHMVKLARVVDRFDRETGLNSYYDQGVDTPEELFFGITQTKAAAFRDEHIELSTGTLLPVDVLSKLPLDKIAAMLGADFSKAVMADDSLEVDLEKFARVAKTLPRDDALLLERAIASAGEAIEQPTLATIG